VPLLDQLKVRVSLGADKAHRHAARTGPARPADAVHIVHRRAREIIVHHRRQVVDVQAPRREIRGHQHAQPARLEMRQRFGPTALTQFTVQRAGVDPRPTKFLRHVLGGVFGRDKDEGAAPAVFLHQVPQQLGSPQGIHLNGTFNNG